MVRSVLRLRLPASLLAAAALLLAAPSAHAVGGPVNVLAPSISGSAAQGSTLTCSPGRWVPTPTGYSYSWQRDAITSIGGASNQYTLTAADVGQAITCTVVAQDSIGTSAPAVSVPPVVPVALPVAAVPVETSLPVIAGNDVQGQTVTCSQGSWDNGPTSYSYSWQRDGTSIAGQLNDRYTLAAGDVSQAITCAVVAANSAGSGPPAVSLPIVPAASGLGGGTGGGGTGGGGASSGGGGSGAPKRGGTAGKAHAPSVVSFSVAPRRMVVSVQGRRQQTKGVTFSYRLSQVANLQVAIERQFTGRMSGRRCLQHPPRRSKGRRCTGYVTATTISVRNAGTGSRRLSYAGRARKSVLASGAYRAVAAAANRAGKSNSRSATFTVVRKTTRAPSRRHA